MIKKVNIYIRSKELPVRGIVDEILFFSDGSASPLDYKYAQYNERIYKTLKTQILLYSVMISEKYNIESKKGYICYTRSKNRLICVDYSENDIAITKNILQKMKKIVILNEYPRATSVKKRCNDCCYRNVCSK